MLRIVTSSIILVLTSYFYFIVNKHVPEPYVDEIFHIPQTQKYCQLQFSYWDNKITTLPGLYIVGFLYSNLLNPILSSNIYCSTAILRSLNLFLLFPILYILNEILQIQERSNKNTNNNNNNDNNINKKSSSIGISQLRALSILVHPVFFFFHFLYYTDVLSTYTVLLVYYYMVKQEYFKSSLIGLFSIVTRQTNIIWVFYCAVLTLIKISTSPSTNQHKLNNNNNSNTYRGLVGLVNEIIDVIKFSLGHISVLLKSLYGYIIVGLSFIAFLWYNQGIVVGDKSNHESSFHFVQVLYFALYTVVFNAPSVILSPQLNPIQFVKSITSSKRSILFTLVTSIVLFKLIQLFTITHIFILSDNRHYSFYLWKNLFNRFETFKYWLIPLYIYSGWVMRKLMAQSNSPLRILAYVMCVSIVLIPTPLFECRYFIVPFFIYQLHTVQYQSSRITILSILYNLSINIITFYVFIRYPFRYPDGTIGRWFW